MKRKWLAVGMVVALVLVFSVVSMVGAETTVPGEVISNVLQTPSPIVASAEGWIELTWTLPSGEVMVGEETEITTTAQRHTTEPIDRVLYIIEVTKEVDTIVTPATSEDITATVSGDDGAGGTTLVDVPVGYDSTGGFFYFGDRTNGFTLSATGTITNTWNVTFKNPGNYTIKAYAVQLPEQPS